LETATEPSNTIKKYTSYLEEISDLHKTEAYVYSQMIAGKTHSSLVNQRIHALGTASWTFYTVSQYILGIQPQYNGLKIDPVYQATGRDLRLIEIQKCSL